MPKNSTSKGAWAVGAAFAAFSGMVALGWLYDADLWVSRIVQEHSSDFLNDVLSAFSFLGSVEIASMALLALLAGLFSRGRRALAERILTAFVATGVLELVMKFYLPQAPIPPEAVEGTGDYAPLITFITPYSYPSGHMVRSVIVFGALCLLSRNRLLRAGFVVVLAGIAASRVYSGTHWASDVVGGTLLGLAALLWAFGKEKPGWRSR